VPGGAAANIARTCSTPRLAARPGDGAASSINNAQIHLNAGLFRRSCESRNPGWKGRNGRPWAPVFAGATIKYSITAFSAACKWRSAYRPIAPVWLRPLQLSFASPGARRCTCSKSAAGFLANVETRHWHRRPPEGVSGPHWRDSAVRNRQLFDRHIRPATKLRDCGGRQLHGTAGCFRCFLQGIISHRDGILSKIPGRGGFSDEKNNKAAAVPPLFSRVSGAWQGPQRRRCAGSGFNALLGKICITSSNMM